VNDEPWELPASWRWARFDEIARVASNLLDPAEHPNSPHIAPNHIESETGRLLPYSSVAEDGVTSAKHGFRPGQILYSKIRPYLAKVVVADFDGLCSADMYPIDTVLEPRYLKWWMLSREFTRRAAGEQARTILPKINVRGLSALPVPVAPSAVQRHIVEILEDHLSRLDSATAQLLQGRTRAYSMERSSLSRCRRGEIVSLADVAEIQGGIQKQPKRAPRANAYPFLRVANVTSAGLDLGDVHRIELFGDELDRLRLRKGDLLVVEGNGSASQIGRAAIWDGSIEDCVHQNHLIRVRARAGLRPDYLEAVWNSPETRVELSEVASSTSGLHTLSVAKLSRLRIPVPGVKEQAVAMGQVDKARQARRLLDTQLQMALKRVGSLRRSLLRAAFAGQLTGGPSAAQPTLGLANV
jgi:type I restriction enzyme, S subunit